jgi:peptide/nickel transport system permease protein
MSDKTRMMRHRMISTIPVLAVIVVFTFLLLEFASGDAVDAYLVQIGGGDAVLRQALREEYGLDQSITARFWLYISSLIRFDLGWSLSFNRPVLSLILERLPNTLLLMGSATFFAFVLGTGIGIAAGSKPNGWLDRITSPLSLALYATPSFWFGLLLVLIFAVKLRIFPTSGMETIASGKQGLDRAIDIAWHLALPVSSLALIYMALFLRVIKTAMQDSWHQDYVAFALSKGLSNSQIIFRHIVPNAFLPVFTVLGLQAAAMLGGSVVIESVFAIPGFGRLARDAVTNRDTPLLMGIILVSAIFVILVNLVVDLVYRMLDPRIDQSGMRR